MRGGLGEDESHLGTGTLGFNTQEPPHLRLPTCEMGFGQISLGLASITCLLCLRLRRFWSCRETPARGAVCGAGSSES